MSERCTRCEAHPAVRFFTEDRTALCPLCLDPDAACRFCQDADATTVFDCGPDVERYAGIRRRYLPACQPCKTRRENFEPSEIDGEDRFRDRGIEIRDHMIEAYRVK